MRRTNERTRRKTAPTARGAADRDHAGERPVPDGFVSSNVSLVVDSERVRLFTDFRYAEAARAVHGVEFVQTLRETVLIWPTCSPALRLREPAPHVRELRDLATAGSSSSRARGLVEGLRAIKDDGSSGRSARGRKITDQAYEQFAEERFVGRTERELAWRMNELFHELGADEPAFETIVAAGAERGAAARRPGRPRDRTGHDVVIDSGACSMGTLRLHAHLCDGAAFRRAPARLRRLPGSSAQGRRGGPGRREGKDTDAAARRSSTEPDSARTSATGSATGSGSTSTRRLGSPRVDRHARHRQRGHDRAGDLPRRHRGNPDRGPGRDQGRRPRGALQLPERAGDGEL